MNYLRDLIYRLRSGQSERQVARDLRLARRTVRKYHELAHAAAYLDGIRICPISQPSPRLSAHHRQCPARPRT
jgi:hypothetical protein